MFENAEIVSSYSRADAIADGVLLDISETVREAGFRYPVAITSGAWAEAVAVQENDIGQDESGRLWDILWVLRLSIQKASGSLVRFNVAVQKGGAIEEIALKSLCHPGDELEPVITIMLPHED